MNFAAINHIPKSKMAYADDENHLHILIQTAKGDIDSVDLIIGDPFEWIYKDGVYVWRGESLERKNMSLKYSTEFHDYYFVRVETLSRRSKYSFIIKENQNEYFYGCRDLVLITENNKAKYLSNLFGYFNYPYIYKSDIISPPSWAKDTVWYSIVPDRFSRESNLNSNIKEKEYYDAKSGNDYFFGGTIKGITEKIPYLSDLGITGIYFTPMFKAYSSHKYDTEDYFQIDPTFGTNEDLRKMVDECHKSGIRVMLDAVFNHCGYDHPFFQDVIKNKRKSKYWDCFFIEDEDFINFEVDKKGHPIYRKQNIKPKYRTFAFTPMMPKWNTDNKIVEEYLLSVAEFWIKEYDIDGWRLDVSNEVSHDFWRKFRIAVHNIKPDTYIMGENWDDSTPWLNGDQQDAVMNYEIAFALWQFFGKNNEIPNIDAETFKNRIDKLLFTYPDNIMGKIVIKLIILIYRKLQTMMI